MTPDLERVDPVHAADLRRHQRLAAYAVLWREPGEILLTRISRHGHHPGAWTLPGGGVDHGEDPRDALVREVREETGLLVRPDRLLDVHSAHFTGRAPDGVVEDFHGVHLILSAELDDPTVQPSVLEIDGTTDAVAWVPVQRIRADEVEVLDVVRAALAHAG
ncbi:MAG: NUDIX domain-containing protein [Nocardioidaceae bacterium]|jgi:8-oxo-dGTP pyrophosphatase MutT (NUDIX family)|nr:NUDIX domain-containing protein [Nocardioidaceae bacterium]